MVDEDVVLNRDDFNKLRLMSTSVPLVPELSNRNRIGASFKKSFNESPSSVD